MLYAFGATDSDISSSLITKALPFGKRFCYEGGGNYCIAPSFLFWKWGWELKKVFLWVRLYKRNGEIVSEGND